MRDQECTTDGNHVLNQRDRQIIPSERLYQPDPKFMSAQSPDNAATYAGKHLPNQRRAGGAEGNRDTDAV